VDEHNRFISRFISRQRIPQDHEVHVLSLALEPFYAAAEALAASLDAGERARAAHMVRADDQTRFVVAHGLLRHVLAAYLDKAAAALRFDAGPHGKPRLRHPSVDLRFNLSHAGEQALIAVAVGREVGVDVEVERPIDELELATRFFSATEIAALARATDRRGSFYRCWTRKESFIKALGQGLSFPLSGFAVSLEPDGEQLLLTCDEAPSQLARWTTRTVPVPSGYAAAVTAEGSDWQMVLSYVPSVCSR
jgi:4'-phosphopantetheinyl transferase